MKKAMLTVFGKDRSGIIAKVTEILFKRGCNLEDISMTILEGEFAMMMILSLRPLTAEGIQKDLQGLKQKWGLSFFWKDLDTRLKLQRGEKHLLGSETYLVSAIGRDRTGIVYQTSRLFAGLGINITDLNSKILGHGTQTLYAMMLEIDVPKNIPLTKLQQALASLSRKLGIELKIKPVERIAL